MAKISKSKNGAIDTFHTEEMPTQLVCIIEQNPFQHHKLSNKHIKIWRQEKAWWYQNYNEWLMFGSLLVKKLKQLDNLCSIWACNPS